ncbi:late competence development ComFB family protein [Paenibacillus sp. CF384]|uniref:late competence development ComFB family protein n=1 Tax=Paenibacillus sp. CF384 TaxID=1884382 RepID=UPI00089C88AD|nr:late competence development ComFB family protein [Paenibacillus sp. CF384]SDX31522.1 competence protein ComFB [Paenibacillus sp. CF384]
MNYSGDLSVLNAMEPIVVSVLEEHYVKTGILKCGCDRCKLDILLLTLNHLPTHYTSSQQGEAYIKAYYLNPQQQSDVLREITEAVKVIELKPHH